MTEDVERMSENPLALITGLENAYVALRDARSDFERLVIRDQAKAAVAAAEVLKRRDIQAEASILVAAAERAIAKANPPQQGRRTDLEDDFVAPDDEVNPHLVRDIRAAHDNLTDEQFQAIANKAREDQEPLTRNVLKREARKFNPPPPSDEPREPTRTERLEAERDAKAMESEERARRIDELEAEVRFLRGEGSDFDHEREATFNRQQAEISALRAELATERQTHNELKQAHRGAIRRIRQLEDQLGIPAPKPVPAPQPTIPEPGEPPQGEPFIEEEVEFEDMAAIDAWETSQWLDGFRVGHFVVTPDGDMGVVADIEQGQLAVRLDNGLGNLVLLEPGQLAHQEAS